VRSGNLDRLRTARYTFNTSWSFPAGTSQAFTVMQSEL
jgi:hypothetical protein